MIYNEISEIFLVLGGFDNASRPQLFHLHSVRLCFEVFTPNEPTVGKTKYTSIGYDVSTLVMDKKSNGLLKIADMSIEKASVLGGDKMIILCDKVRVLEISIVFYEEDDDGHIVWQEEINHMTAPTSLKVHHQHAISFETPKYRELDIRQPTKNTFVKLVRLNETEYSEAFRFQFEPTLQSMFIILIFYFEIKFHSGNILVLLFQKKRYSIAA